MTKSLAYIFTPVEPFCKDYKRFLYGAATLLQHLSEWKLIRGKIAWAEATDGVERNYVTWHDDPDEYIEDESYYYSAPTDITVHYEFPIRYDSFIAEFTIYSGTKAAIKDDKGFKAAMKQVLADSSKTKILAKILADSIKFGLKYDYLEGLIGNSTLLDKELVKVIEADIQKNWEPDTYFAGSYLGPHPKKLLGYTAKATGSEFVLKFQLDMEVDPSEWDSHHGLAKDENRDTRYASLETAWFKSAAWSMTEREYDALKKGQRVEIDFSGGMASGKVLLEVGRTSYSKKYDVYSKKLYYIDEATNKPITKGKVVFTLFKRMSYRGEVYDTPKISLAKGNMGVQVKSLRKKGSEIKLAADMKKLLAEVFRGVQPHVKNWRKFLVGMEDELKYWSANTNLPFTSDLKSIDVDTTEEIFEGKQLGGGWHEPPYYQEWALDVPESFEFHVVHALDLRRLPMFLGKAMRSNIQNAAGFSQAISDVISNSAAMNMVGKIMIAVVKNYAKDGQGWEFLTEHDESLWGEISDELGDHTSTAVSYSAFDPTNFKLKKVWYKITGRGIEINIAGKANVEAQDGWSIDDDAFEPDPDDWNNQRDYRVGSKLGYDA